jgi:hypothetical protein
MDRALLPGRGAPAQHLPFCGPSFFSKSTSSFAGEKLASHVFKPRRTARDVTRRQIVQAIAAPEKVKPLDSAAFLAWADAAKVKKREDIKSIMILGAGPIVIGQVLSNLRRMWSL